MEVMVLVFFFFFSSRRRHTRLQGDWSSDVCSSDLSVGLGELSHFWLGDFVMLWRPASSPVKALSAGMRGAEVRWLRRSLQRLQSVADDAPVSDLFDAELTGWVRDFQRRHQLAVDGIAGVRTQIALAGAVGGADTPLLSAVDTDHHGGWSMSLILPAPKKSASDRQRPSRPALFQVKGAPPRSALPLWAVPGAAVLGGDPPIRLW